MRVQCRIVLALLGVFVSIGALVWALHGLIFDDAFATWCGAVIVTVSIGAVVALLNLASDGSRP